MPEGYENLEPLSVEIRQQLKAVESRYSIADNLLEGYQVIGFDWRYLYVNNAAAHQAAQPRENLLGYTLMEKFPGVEHTEMFAVLRRTLEDRTSAQMENHFSYPDGSDAWFELSIQPVPDGVLVLSLDITKYKRVQAELQRYAGELEQRVSEHTAELQAEKRQLQYQASLQDNVTDAVMVTDLDFRIQSWNRAAERIYGWRAEEVIGKNAVEALRMQFSTDDERAQLGAIFRERGWWQGEIIHHRKDGTPVNILGSVTLVKDENDVPIGVVSVNHDITERKRAENTLREREMLYRMLAENITDVVARSDLDGICTYISPSCIAVMGYLPEELIGRTYLEFIHPDDVDAVAETFARAMRNASPRIVSTYRFRHKQGHYFWIESVGRPIYSAAGEVEGYVTSSRDITERRESENALRKAFEKEKELGELKSRFVSMASHEFRTPLASILAVTETLTAYRHKLTDEQIDVRFGRIKDQIGLLKAIMEDVLLLSKMQSRRVEFVPELLDLDSLTRSVLDEFISQSELAHTIEYQCDPALKHVLLDKKLVRQTISNLVSNALKYSPDGTTVNVSLEVEARNVLIKVRDQGIGIPEADQPRLFDAFHRAANVGAISGTGLGLVIAKESVDLHGGTISFESQLNQGTTFYVRLPIRSTEGIQNGENSAH